MTMGYGDWMPWAAAVGLMSLRIGVAVGLAPPMTAYGLPMPARALVVLVLSSLAVDEGSTRALRALASNPTGLFVAAGIEAFVGMLLGLGVHVALAAFALAGRLLDVQVGLGIGSIFDPVTRASASVLSQLMSLLGVTLFFVTDAHLALISLVGHSVAAMPLGEMPEFDDPVRLLTATGRMFSIGVALAAPVLVALLATDVLIGIASRNLPQINVLVLGMPIKVLVGYMVLALSVPLWAPLAGNVFAGADDVLGARR